MNRLPRHKAAILSILQIVALGFAAGCADCARRGDVLGYLTCAGLAVYALVWCERILPTSIGRLAFAEKRNFSTRDSE